MKIFRKLSIVSLALSLLIQGSVTVLATNPSNYETDETQLLLAFDDEEEIDDDYIPDGWYDLEYGNLDVDTDIEILELESEPIESEEYLEGVDDSELVLENAESLTFSATNAQQTTIVRRTAVTVVNTNFRSGSGTSYNLIRSVPANTNVRITGRRGNWFRVVQGGTTGWMHRNSLQTTRQTAIVRRLNANLRSGPGARYSLLTRVTSGTRLLIDDRTANWAQVTANGHTGWIHVNNLGVGLGRRPGRARNAVTLHTRPNGSTNIMRRLPRHQEFMVLQRTTNGDGINQGWTQVRIRHDNGTQTGWVRTNQVEFTGQSRRTIGRGTHPVRTGPGTAFRVSRRINTNMQVTVLSEVGNWSQVRFNQNGVRRYGWIANGRLTRINRLAQPNNSNTTSNRNNVGAATGNRGAASANPTWGVTYGSAQLRSGTGTGHNVLQTIPHDTIININRRSGSWLQVTRNRQTGYVHEDSVRVATSPITPDRTGILNTSSELRQGAGGNHVAIRTLSTGSNVIVLSQSGEWLRVRAGNDEGWVREDHVNTTALGTLNIGTPLRNGAGHGNNVIIRIPSGHNVTILRQQGVWLNVEFGDSIGWIHSLYVNINYLSGLPNVRNTISSTTNTANVTDAAGLRIVIPARRTIGVGNTFNFIEGFRAEHVAANGNVTNIPITFNQTTFRWEFIHNQTTFTFDFEGILDNLTPGTYERQVIVRRGNTVVARANQTVVVR